MYTTLRLIHMIFGIFVGGTYLFTVPILEPRLKKLGPATQGAVIGAVMPILTPIMGLSLTGLVVTGLLMMERGRGLSALFDGAWGVVIGIGLVATVGSLIVGFGILAPAGVKMAKIKRAALSAGREPTPEEIGQIKKIAARINFMSMVNFALILTGVATMLIARYY